MTKTKSRHPKALPAQDYPDRTSEDPRYSPSRLAGLGKGPRLREGEASGMVRLRTTTHGMGIINALLPEVRAELLLRGLGMRDADAVADALDHTYPGRTIVPYATPDAPGLYLLGEKVANPTGNLDWAHEVATPEDTVVARLDGNNTADAWALLSARRVVLVAPADAEYGEAWEPREDPAAPDRVVLLRR